MSGIDGGLRLIFRTNLPLIHWTSIESGLTESGIPDAEGCLHGNEFWNEYKQTNGWKIAKNRTTTFQIAWHERRARSGGRSFISVRRNSTADELWMFFGKDVRAVYTGGLLATPPIGNWEGGPSKWPWDKIRTILVGA